LFLAITSYEFQSGNHYYRIYTLLECDSICFCRNSLPPFQAQRNECSEEASTLYGEEAVGTDAKSKPVGTNSLKRAVFSGVGGTEDV
jgi:hypothetical protein